MLAELFTFEVRSRQATQLIPVILWWCRTPTIR